MIKNLGNKLDGAIYKYQFIFWLKMKTLLKNCRYVLTQDNKKRILKNSDILIDGNKISEIGEIKQSVDEVLDCSDFLVIPGLINTHTHASMTLFRGMAEDLELEEWLKNKVWPMESKLDGKSCYYGALLACIEMVKNGITCFADMYFFMDSVARACKEIGIRAVLGSVFFDFKTMESDEPFETAKRFVKKWKNDDLIVPAIMPHAPYTCSEELLIKAKEFAEKEDVLLHTHLAETRKEQVDFEKKFNMREIERLEKIGFLCDRLLAAHCVWLTKNEIKILAKNKVKVSHCPVSNMKLVTGGVSPVPEMVREGVTVSLGTDGAASNNNLDIFETMKFCALMHKFYKWDPTIVKADQILDFATLNGARALLLDKKIGSIEIGKKADLVLIDIRKENFLPIVNEQQIINHLVYSSRGKDVNTVICDGKVILRDGKILSCDEKKIFSEFQEIAKKF